MPLSFVSPSGLSSDQKKKLIAYNEQIGLTENSIRLVQYLVGATPSGIFDELTIDGLIAAFGSGGSHDPAIVGQKREALKEFRQRWENVQAGMGPPGPEDAQLPQKIRVAEADLSSLENQLSGGLNKKILGKMVSELTAKGQQGAAILLVADFVKTGLNPDQVSFRFDKGQNASYLTRFELTDTRFGEADEFQRGADSLFFMESAPSPNTIVSIGTKAFQNIESLCETLQKALNFKVGKVTHRSVENLLFSSQKEKALSAIEPRFTGRRSLMALIRLTGAEVSPDKTEKLVELVASLQKRLGLGADGILGEGQSIPGLFNQLKKTDEHELMAWFLIGMYNMWEKDLTQLFYSPGQSEAVNTFSEAPGLKFVTLGPVAFAGGFEDLARALAPSVSPLKEFTGSNISGFQGKRIWLDAAFHPGMEKVHGFAVDNGLKILVTSPFRAEGAAVGGAVVSPAQFSNHKAGHAIDMNVFVPVNGQMQLHNNAMLNPSKEGSWPQPLKNFIRSIRDDEGLRWGGDFNTPDAVHIDDGLNLTRNKNSNFLQRYIATQSAHRFGAIDGAGTRSLGTRGLDAMVEVDEVSEICDH